MSRKKDLKLAAIAAMVCGALLSITYSSLPGPASATNSLIEPRGTQQSDEPGERTAGTILELGQARSREILAISTLLTNA